MSVETMLEMELEHEEELNKVLSLALMRLEGCWEPIETIPDERYKSYLVKTDKHVRYVYVGYHFEEKRLYDCLALDAGSYIRVTGATHWLNVDLTLRKDG